MIESLGPLVSLFELFIDGISKAIKLPSGYKRNRFCRKVIIFQLHLEDIIENAHVILDILDKSSGNQLIDNKEECHELFGLISNQQSSITEILRQFDDHDMMNVLKTFTPDTRRKLEMLLYFKGAVLGELMHMLQFLAYSLESKPFPDHFFPVTNLSDWDNENFITKGRPYAKNNRSLIDSEQPVSDFCHRLAKQDQILKELEECSLELSKFIATHMDLNDVIRHQNK